MSDPEEIAERGVQSVDDALTMADAIIDDPDGGVEWLMGCGCDVIEQLRDEVRRLRDDRARWLKHLAEG